MLKAIFKALLPHSLLNYLRRKKARSKVFMSLLQAYLYDFRLYYKHSDSCGSDTALKLAGRITREYHVLEKGLTMPQSRLGFGKEKVIALCQDCHTYLATYGSDEEQVQQALGVLTEYKQFHDQQGYQLDPAVLAALATLKINATDVPACPQINMTKPDYFKYAGAPFGAFSQSRSSVRNFTDEAVPLEKITAALELARHAPSACNRQTWRTRVYTRKEELAHILEVQGGNTGFGHLADKLIVITGEVGLFCGPAERNQVFIDGGMYAMHVLFALHHHQIAACGLNCSTAPEKDKQLRSLCQINPSEVFIAMLACGIPPQNFRIAASKRYRLDKTNRMF